DHVEGADGTLPWTDLPDALPHAFELFLDAIVGKDAELINVDDMVAHAAVMEAFYKAAASNTWVQIEKPGS
ncbi:MAG: gfo/Idh/MocA family oxidoreductase, partial [Anaerolineae bacterium]|nr:gfo/Idh/MocA family oxidoreductase [Anaerolineae bacterium]